MFKKNYRPVTAALCMAFVVASTPAPVFAQSADDRVDTESRCVINAPWINGTRLRLLCFF